MLRTLQNAATRLGDRLFRGRKALSDEIERRKLVVIEQAADEARAEIKERGGTLLSRSSRDIATKAAMRLAFLAGLFTLRQADVLPAEMFAMSAASGLAVFFIIDLIRNIPNIRIAHRHLHLNGWNPIQAGREAIAASVFESVLARAQHVKLGTKETLALHVTGTHLEKVKREIAHAVAQITRDTSLRDIRSYAVLAGINISTFWIFYAAATWLIFQAR